MQMLRQASLCNLTDEIFFIYIYSNIIESYVNGMDIYHVECNPIPFHRHRIDFFALIYVCVPIYRPLNSLFRIQFQILLAAICITNTHTHATATEKYSIGN